ncbi:hypothetical protein [Bathymodiolus platifrons methanotrophic gill symbiont]|uniref:hypothetical protein n=1 Tax=Bathymodiolus platifrons methanotrophic gill symbiont TaxID=113268 RepID=UPI001124E173|nr:hypothetical protein [Bathymodiolus platifrons methanotrophic gill symbiont]
MATSNGSTAIRDKILASLARFGLATTLRLLETISPSGADSEGFAINMAKPPKINLDTPALCISATQ